MIVKYKKLLTILFNNGKNENDDKKGVNGLMLIKLIMNTRHSDGISIIF